MRRFCIGAALALLSAFLAGPASAQWLPAERQAHERKLWESSGVEFPSGLHFYELPKVSQRLVGIVNYSPENRYGIFRDTWRGFDGRSENVNAQYPWVTPSGLHDSPKDQWRKVGAAYFPGPVKVYREHVAVENGGFVSVNRGMGWEKTNEKAKQNQPHLAWTFPDGTIFAELLIRTHRGQEWPFEIRMYEVRAGKMINAETYRPDVPIIEARKVTVPPGKLADFGFKDATLTLSRRPQLRIAFGNDVRIIDAEHTPKDGGPPAQPPPPGVDFPRKVKLFAARYTLTADDDHSIVPRGYLGNVRTCTDCHNQAGKPTGYGLTTIRGSAPALSWHPFSTDKVNSDAMPVLDRRWPLAE